ncbi:MAG: phage holin [Clostridia bacterium]|nr:phage holin [Clostridia bacterium]
MKINWKVRLRNRVWLTTLLATVVAFVFDVLALMDVAPTLTEATVMQAVTALLTLLTALGVIIDPTTPGTEDSDRAMEY